MIDSEFGQARLGRGRFTRSSVSNARPAKRGIVGGGIFDWYSKVRGKSGIEFNRPVAQRNCGVLALRKQFLGVQRRVPRPGFPELYVLLAARDKDGCGRLEPYQYLHVGVLQNEVDPQSFDACDCGHRASNPAIERVGCLSVPDQAAIIRTRQLLEKYPWHLIRGYESTQRMDQSVMVLIGKGGSVAHFAQTKLMRSIRKDKCACADYPSADCARPTIERRLCEVLGDRFRWPKGESSNYGAAAQRDSRCNERIPSVWVHSLSSRCACPSFYRHLLRERAGADVALLMVCGSRQRFGPWPEMRIGGEHANTQLEPVSFKHFPIGRALR